MKNKQRGVSLIGILLMGGMLAFLVIIAMQVFPTLVEFQAISKAASKAQVGNSALEVRKFFDKAAQVDDIKSIAGKDIEVTKEDGKTVVSFAYNREIHLGGPAFLLLKYVGRSK